MKAFACTCANHFGVLPALRLLLPGHHDQMPALGLLQLVWHEFKRGYWRLLAAIGGYCVTIHDHATFKNNFKGIRACLYPELDHKHEACDGINMPNMSCHHSKFAFSFQLHKNHHFAGAALASSIS